MRSNTRTAVFGAKLSGAVALAPLAELTKYYSPREYP
jgi:hypothetical protein